MALAQDILTRIVNVNWGGRIYAIIVAEGSYAIADPDKDVTVVDQETDPEVTGVTGAPVTATLLECSSDAGEDFATINVTAGSSGAAERVEVIVCPKTDDAEGDWFNMYVVPISRDRENPTAPFLWRLSTMRFTAPRLIRFKIRYEPHITGPELEGSVPMVQMMPTTEPVTDTVGAHQLGYQVFAYRIDQEGTAEMFQGPPEWNTDDITDPGAFGARQTGLLFGTDPPLIAADVPFE